MKGVFLISQPLKGATIETLRDIIVTSKFQFIVLITNLHPISYGETDEYIDSLKDNCLTWMKDAVTLFSPI